MTGKSLFNKKEGVFLLDFIVKYWIQFGLGLIVAGLTWLSKYFYKLYKNEKSHQKTKEQKQFYDEIKEAISAEHAITKQSLEEERKSSMESDKIIEKKVGSLEIEINNLKYGILSMQRRDFITDCRALLNPDHEITLDEYEQIMDDHKTYNSLGGNHKGDEWYRMVEQKFKSSLVNKKREDT